MNTRRVKAVLVLSACLLISGALFAQSDLGTISGFVKDPSGGTIAGAKVTIQNKSGVERQATTNESGYYTITNVPPGLYTVSVDVSGFKRFQSNEDKLDPSANLVVDATLSVGSSSQIVEVSASAVQLQTESASVQKLVTREELPTLRVASTTRFALGSSLSSLD